MQRDKKRGKDYMAKMGIVENGLKRRRGTKRRRRNPVAVVAKKRNPARRNVSLSTAKSIIKKNGLKAVSLKTVGNGRKRYRNHKRNGVAAVSARRNGFFGNSKSDAKNVIQLGVGAIGIKAVGRPLSGIVTPILSQIGLGQYAEILTDAGLAIFVAPFVANKVMKGSGDMVRLGGLLAVALDAVEIFFPNFLSLNPFNNSPVIMTGAGAAVAPAAVAQLALDVQNGSTSAAQVASVMRSLDSGGAQVINSGGGYAYNGLTPELVM